MIWDDLITARRSSKRPICGVIVLWIAFVEAISLFLIGTAFLMAWWPYLWGSGQIFQPTERIKVLKQECSQSATNNTNKKAKKLSLSLFASITNPENENGYGAQGYSFCGAYWVYTVILPAMRIEPTKAVTTLSRWTSSLQNLLPLLQKTTKKLQIILPGGAYPVRFYN